MDWLNYHHLFYFWTVAKEHGVSKAAAALHVAQPTVSAQLRSLERSLGRQLFERQGRSLVLTPEGEKVFRYADEIFSLGREMLQAVKGEPQHAPKRFRAGVSDALPKLTTYRLLEPALAVQPAWRLHVRIDKTERLLGELAVHAVDLVIADAPMMPSLSCFWSSRMQSSEATPPDAMTGMRNSRARRTVASTLTPVSMPSRAMSV